MSTSRGVSDDYEVLIKTIDDLFQDLYDFINLILEKNK